ncbi:hypothetical protein ABI59_03180 [Acidobacteria bacterium Mor1]|nr:hypothetical protein ABI59_03180 [Acidobacteria bacterium Mor1]
MFWTRYVVIPAMLAACLATPVLARGGETAIGVRGGDHTGATFSAVLPVVMGPALFAEVGAGVAGPFDDAFEVTGQLRHYFTPAAEQQPFALYWSPGARFVFGSETRAGLQVPLGVSALIPAGSRRWEVFLEVTPTLDFAPRTEGDVYGAAGLRYHFDR